ncbi:hypothetical protein DRJ16_07780, partial [Candidatus Woesearchaeota archaeon]
VSEEDVSAEADASQETEDSGSDISGAAVDSSDDSSDEGDSGEDSSDEGDSGGEDSSGDSGEEGVSITGAVVSTDGSVVGGSVYSESDFVYSLEPGQTARIVEDSVKINGEKIEDIIVSLNVENGQVTVSTDYFVNEHGFGEEYLGDYGLTLSIDVEDFEVYAEPGKITIDLVYQDKSIATYSQEVSVLANEENVSVMNETIGNETVGEINISMFLVEEIPMIRIGFGESVNLDLNNYFSGVESYEFEAENISAVFNGSVMTLTSDESFKGARTGKITGLSGGESVESNDFTILVSSGAVNVKTSRSKIVVGEKVKWKKEVSLDVMEDIVVEIPEVAENVLIKKVEAGEEVKAGSSLLTGEVVIELDLEKKWSLRRWLQNLWRGMTGRVVTDLNESSSGGVVDVVLKDNATEYVIEYETEAPALAEKNTTAGKLIVISGPDKVEYTDVIAFTDLDNSVMVGEEAKIKLYWYNYEAREVEIKKVGEVAEEEVVEGIENFSESLLTGAVVSEFDEEVNETVNVTREIRQEVPFDAYDLNGDGMLDYIEWVVPHLSNQTYEIVISDLGSSLSSVVKDGNYYHLGISNIAPYDSLVGYWSFDADLEDTALTTHYDFSDEGNDGTGKGDAVVNESNCVYGDCLHLDASDDAVQIGSDNDNPLISDGSNFTISVWFNT